MGAKVSFVHLFCIKHDIFCGGTEEGVHWVVVGAHAPFFLESHEALRVVSLEEYINHL